MENINRTALLSMTCDLATDDIALVGTETIHKNWKAFNYLKGSMFRVDWTIIVVCRRGYFTMIIDGKEYKCTANNIVICASSRMLRIEDVSDDFDGFVFAYALNFVKTNLKYRFAPQISLELNPMKPIGERGIAIMANLYDMLINVMSIPDMPNRSSAVAMLLETSFEIMRNIIDVNPKVSSTAEYHTEIFLQLLEKYVLTQHGLDFYADKMNISTKRLMESVKEATGYTAFVIGDYYLMVLVKHKLMEPKVPLKEVAQYAGFPSQSAFGTWFKRKVGVSPSAYRKSTKSFRPV